MSEPRIAGPRAPGHARGRRRRAGAAVAALVLWAAAARAQPGAAQPTASRALTARELTAIRSVVGGEPQWSPDGSRLLFDSPLGDGGLWTIGADGGFPTSLNVSTGGTTFLGSNQPEWSPNGRWISYVSTKSGSPELWLSSVGDGREIQLTRLGGHINSYAWAPDGGSIAFAGDKQGSFDVWVVSVPTGEVRQLTREPLLEVYPRWTPDSREVVYVRLDSTWRNHDVLARPAAGGAARVVVRDTDFFDYQGGGAFGYPLVSPDGRSVLFRSHRSGWLNYWVAPMAGGAPRPVAPEAANQSGARWSPTGEGILFLSLDNGTQTLRSVPAPGGPVRTLAAPPGMGLVTAANWSPDGQRISYLLATPASPGDLYVVPSAGGASRRLTVSDPPEHVQRALIAPEKVTYRAADATEVRAYLYRPRGLAPGATAPGLLWIHGGPTAQFSDNLQRDVQFFAMRGYAVLLPNIRGSSGYGKAFEDANNRCWGRCDLKDVLAGVEFLRTLPEVRADRMGITGSSYGGYMSLAAPTFAPSVFQAAVAASAYGDWIHTYREQETRHLKLMDYEFGPFATSQDVYRRSSPIYELERLQTPIMLVHGAATRIPRSEASRLFADRMEMLYKPFVYKTYPNENYYVSGRANVMQMLEDMRAFLDQHLKDGAPPARSEQVARP
jgi:dipeptidyl aminopeptidase/acylaminoacyl peptidase